MKIAILGPSPVPYTIGGMEYLLWGLYEHINKDTPHSAELIKIPVDESGFWPLIESYRKFYDLNLDHFDMVVTTKYPAWMVRHENQLCYMCHRLRGLYDTYHFTGLPLKPDAKHPAIKRILDYMALKGSTPGELFELLDELKPNREDIPEHYFAFPGPFIRSIVHFLDGYALSNEAISRFAAISRTVEERREYFPRGARVDVVYPPSALPCHKEGEYDYLFTVSRLDNAKRIALMVKAMAHVKGDVRLKIAGTGPMEAELKAMAAGDARIEFLGFVNDEQVIDYYSNARAVLFMPYEEDYGLVTIEAMKSRKPVITCTDSGGPLEFVRHGVNGYIAEPSPESVAKCINELLALSGEELREMGNRAFEAVEHVTWNTVMTRLFVSGSEAKARHGASGRPAETHRPHISGQPGRAVPYTSAGQTAGAFSSGRVRGTGSRKKITVASTFPVFPPKGGGQARLYNLYKNIAAEYDVDIIAFTNGGEKPFDGEIAPGVREIRIPKSQLHIEKEWEIQKKIDIPVGDVAASHLSRYTREYGEALARSLKSSDLAVAAHPYLVRELNKYRGSKPLVYEAVDVEYHTKSQNLPESRTGRELLKSVFETEKLCCSDSAAIIACSGGDMERLNEYYGIPLDKMTAVPNGVDCRMTEYITLNERAALKERVGIEGERLALFMGSWHPPNLKACEAIFEFAPETPDIKYLIMGSQCLAFKGVSIPQNVGMLGPVDEDVKNIVFGLVDAALNPMTSGSGTNLKMFDYMAAGIPVLTTEFGARGIDEVQHFTTAGIEEFPRSLRELLESDPDEMSARLLKARTYVEENFDWPVLAKIYLEQLKKLL